MFYPDAVYLPVQIRYDERYRIVPQSIKPVNIVGM